MPLELRGSWGGASQRMYHPMPEPIWLGESFREWKGAAREVRGAGITVAEGKGLLGRSLPAYAKQPPSQPPPRLPPGKRLSADLGPF